MAIYEGFRALDLFTDRHEIIHHFATRLHERTDDRIILYRGDGGNGKPLLLRYLKTNCCKVLPPEDWAYTSTLTGQDFVDNFTHAPQATPIPVIDHDFAIAGMQVPQIALFELRRRLSGHHLRYSVALASYAKALALAPNLVMAQNNLGSCQTSLGELQARLGESELAKASYSAAIASYNRVVEIAPKDPDAQSRIDECQSAIDRLP